MSSQSAVALISIAAELRESIAVFIPQIVELLNDNSSNAIRGAAAKTLAKLSDHGNSSTQSAVALLQHTAVEFRQSIRASIPRIIDLLKNSTDSNACRAGLDALGKISEQGNTGLSGLRLHP
jgi:HEAT repeat protein